VRDAYFAGGCWSDALVEAPSLALQQARDAYFAERTPVGSGMAEPQASEGPGLETAGVALAVGLALRDVHQPETDPRRRLRLPV
jgi:hypothetical protein